MARRINFAGTWSEISLAPEWLHAHFERSVALTDLDVGSRATPLAGLNN
jgi:hypothetical protein